MLRFIQKVIFGKAAREYEEGRRTSPLEGVSIGVMLALLLVFGFHPAFVTDSLNQGEEIEDPAAAQVLSEASINQGNAPMTEEEIHQLDSTLAAAGFKDDERASIIAQMKAENSSGADEVNENTVKGASDDE
jgi:NADH-quinone oxidoreductase subunit M